MHALTLLFTVLFTLLIVASVVFKPLKKLLKRRRYRLIYALCVVAAVSGIVVSLNLNNDDSKVENPKITIVEDKNKTEPKIAAQPNLPAYEILNKDKKALATRLTVYILEKDRPRIKALNQFLVSQELKSPITKVSIDYFDDKKIASSYFDQIKAKGITNDQKKLLVSHYVALSSTDLSTPDKILFLSDGVDVSKQLQSSSSGATR